VPLEQLLSQDVRRLCSGALWPLPRLLLDSLVRRCELLLP
jgi:hypothetical protein